MENSVAVGPKTLAVMYVVIGYVSLCVLKKIVSCCVDNQRSSLRDEPYESELTNRLLLPNLIV